MNVAEVESLWNTQNKQDKEGQQSLSVTVFIRISWCCFFMMKAVAPSILLDDELRSSCSYPCLKSHLMPGTDFVFPKLPKRENDFILLSVSCHKSPSPNLPFSRQWLFLHTRSKAFKQPVIHHITVSCDGRYKCVRHSTLIY